MKQKIEITNISFDSLFKLFFFGIFPVVMCFCLIAAIGVFLQVVPENPEPNQLYGWQAVFGALVLGVMWPLMAGLFFAAFGKLGLFASFKLKKSLLLEVAVAEKSEINSGRS